MNFKPKLLLFAFSVLFLFCLSGCWFFSKKEYTEWLVNGEYEPLYPAQNTTKKFMEYLESGDIEPIYEVFSPTAKQQQKDLRERLQTLSDFVQNEVISWEHSLGGNIPSTTVRDGQVIRYRTWFVRLQTKSEEYEGYAIDVLDDDFNPQNIGFYSFSIYPKDLSFICTGGAYDTDDDKAGIFISYPSEPPNSVVQKLTEFVTTNNDTGIYDLFLPDVQTNIENLSDQIKQFLLFMDKPFLTCKFYGCVVEPITDLESDNSKIKRHSVFLIETENQSFAVHIRDFLSEPNSNESLGIYSIVVHPEEFTREYQNIDWRYSGIIVKQLTLDITLDNPQKDSFSLLFTTSIEAKLECNPPVAMEQIDSLRWKVSLPHKTHKYYTFVATTDTESITQFVSVDKNGKVILYDKFCLD